MDAYLGMNLLYATKRWPEPDVWGQQVGERWGLDYVQFVFDLLDPRTVLPEEDEIVIQSLRDIAGLLKQKK